MDFLPAELLLVVMKSTSKEVHETMRLVARGYCNFIDAHAAELPTEPSPEVHFLSIS